MVPPEGVASSREAALREWYFGFSGAASRPLAAARYYRPLHLPVPVLRLEAGGTEDIQMPLAAAPGFDDLGGHYVDQDLRERPPFRVPFQVIGGLVPREARIEDHRQEEVVAVVHDDQLAAGALERRMVDQVFLGAVRPDVALQRELAGDDLLDRDLLFPAVTAIALLAARLRDVLGATERAF